MSVWVNPNKAKAQEQERKVWVNPKKPTSFPGKGFALGLGQAAEDTFKGLVSHGAEPEVDIPDFFKPEKIRNRPETNRSPSLGLESHVHPDQKFQFNVGRYAPELVGAGIGAVKGIKGAANLLKPITNKGVGQNIVKEVKDLKKGFNKEYNDIFDIGEKNGVKNIKSSVSNSELQKILGEVDKKYYKGLANFIENPTTRNAHRAQSDLGKFIRKMEGKRELVSFEHKALKSARSAQEALKNEVYSGLLKEGGLDLPFKYLDVTDRYKKQMVPYLENSAVRKASLKPGQKGYIKPERLPRKLTLESSDPLMAHLRGNIEGTKIPLNPYLKGKHSMLEVNRALAPIIKYGVIGAGGYTGYNLIKSLLGNS